MAVPLINTFTATGASSAFKPDILPVVGGRFNIEIRGAFVATVALQRSFDSTNWVTVTKPDMSDATFTAPTSFSAEEVEYGASYRLNCVDYTSGTVNYRISQ